MYAFCGTGSFVCDPCVENNAIEKELAAYDLRNMYNKTFRTNTEQERQRLVGDTFNGLAKEEEQLSKITQLTVLQSASKHWSAFRTGRITASILKDVCRTSVAKPSLSLIRKICYAEKNSVQTLPMRYGRDKEHIAFERLFEAHKHCHVNPRKEPSGLIISAEDSCLGASPDGFIFCECHGKICIEIKCPFSGKDHQDFTDILLKLSDPFLKRAENGNILRNTCHKYFYQAIMQIHISKVNLGYFYVWSPGKQYLFEVKRNDCFWDACRRKALIFYNEVVLPELLYKAFTNPL